MNSTCLCPRAPSTHHYQCHNAANPFRRPAGQDAARAETDPSPALTRYARSWALDDVQILRTADGHSDGRTVSAYAAVFDTPAEIHDKHGHYNEVIHRTAFNRQLREGIAGVHVLYNHGLTAHGTPSELGAVPIGSPVKITADSKGLHTVTRFNRSALAEAVLEAIRAGDLKGYSFRGRILRSSPDRVPARGRAGALPTVTRMELGLTEYGPTPLPAYVDARILRAAVVSVDARRARLTLQLATRDRGIPPLTTNEQLALRNLALEGNR